MNKERTKLDLYQQTLFDNFFAGKNMNYQTVSELFDILVETNNINKLGPNNLTAPRYLVMLKDLVGTQLSSEQYLKLFLQCDLENKSTDWYKSPLSLFIIESFQTINLKTEHLFEILKKCKKDEPNYLGANVFRKVIRHNEKYKLSSEQLFELFKNMKVHDNGVMYSILANQKDLNFSPEHLMHFLDTLPFDFHLNKQNQIIAPFILKNNNILKLSPKQIIRVLDKCYGNDENYGFDSKAPYLFINFNVSNSLHFSHQDIVAVLSKSVLTIQQLFLTIKNNKNQKLGFNHIHDIFDIFEPQKMTGYEEYLQNMFLINKKGTPDELGLKILAQLEAYTLQKGTQKKTHPPIKTL